MFRITTHAGADGFVMKLEGTLSGAWVAELDACWREAVPRMEGRGVKVDLTGLCHVDTHGVQLMARMYRMGAGFVARGCVMPEVVREISETAGAHAVLSEGS